ncbi:MAG: RNA-binding transcriptional accessory protein [Megasphaera elsdenii]|nr:RNA-binding transcriptional accessory protein [Megasphaera elsdenii]
MTEETMIAEIARTLGIQPSQVQSALSLFAQGNTLPFIARYRKEATGSLDEVQLRCIQEQYDYEQALASRKETVRQSIIDQGCWNDELAEELEAARQLQDVEDLYLPYKPKKRTKASMAREAGLEPLADLFLSQRANGPAPEKAAQAYLTDEVPSVEDAIQGAANILAERFSERADFRRILRRDLWHQARLTCSLQVEESEAGPMLTYADFSERIARIPSYRILAINRGENEKKLKVTLKEPADEHIDRLCRLVIQRHSPYEAILCDAAADSYKRLISPQMEREIRNELTAQAEKQAIDVFAENLRHVLLQPPFAGQTILGLDPGFRTGCKAAIIDATGRVLAYGTYYLTKSLYQKEQSAKALARMIQKYGVTLISIGNGTASYETEQFVSSLIADYQLSCRYVIANEAGASVYSASGLAREELPDLDVTIRGAVSIARRIQDPLAESVKIDPRAIGVGQYQHDVNQKALSAALDQVVTSVVNYVGVDLNTASAALLQHISGLTAATAANIVAYRDENGPFQNRQDLLNVPRLGPATFTQCAGFLRIKDGSEPLDNTSVHPESYGLAEKIASHYGLSHEDLKDPDKLAGLRDKIQMNAAPKLAAVLDAGEPTIKDILEELRKPGRDVRSEFPKPLTRRHVMSLDDLQIGTVVRGTVQNVVDFGAFVDFGLKTPGLVHRSQLSRHPFRHPTDVVHAGDIVEAEIISVDAARGRIGLSMKKVKK